MKLKDKKVLVTGSAGFIGSHLVEQLIGMGADVRAMVHYNSARQIGNLKYVDPRVLKNAEIIFGDVNDKGFVKKAVNGVDAVFHLAALIAIPYSYEASESYIQTNITGTHNVLRSCLEEEIELLVHTSTSETYGTALYTPIDEKHPLQGQSPYSASKIGADKIVESFNLSYGLPVATIRPFNSYGPRQSARAVIPTIITQMVSNKKEIELGSLDTVRDFTFVKDTAKGFIAVAQCPKLIGQVTNVGSGEYTSIGDLVDTLKKITGIEKKVKIDKSRIRPKNSEVMTLICDSKKVKKLAGWKPDYSLKEGLKDTVAFLKKNLGAYSTDQYII